MPYACWFCLVSLWFQSIEFIIHGMADDCTCSDGKLKLANGAIQSYFESIILCIGWHMLLQIDCKMDFNSSDVRFVVVGRGPLGAFTARVSAVKMTGAL